jgi:hypothetical protein
LASGAIAMAKLALAVARTNANDSWWYPMPMQLKYWHRVTM